MESAVTIGLDLGKSVFQVHGIDAGGSVVIQRRLTRGKLLGFLQSSRRALWGWKPVLLPVIGDESFRSWGMGAPDATPLRKTLCQTAEE